MIRPLALVLLVGLAGCLPSSQRETDRSISAADSASTALAATVPVDTLAEVWTARAPESDPMPVPSSLVWAGGRLAVVEAQQGSVRWLSSSGAYQSRTDLPAESYPYAAGARGDTAVVLARGLEALLWTLPDEGVVRRVPAPAGARNALATDGTLAVRLGGGPEGEAPAVAVLDESGLEAGRVALAGPAWRSVGFLREWDGRVAALSGYRPVVDVVGLDGGLEADTLALEGFASPQLVRSAQFMRGEADEPPLLSSSAAALGERLFVLNLRTDRLRVDVYGPDGRLRRVLVGPTAGLEADVALDVAAREVEGAVELAVLYSRPPGVLQTPESRVVLFRWGG